MMPLDLQELHYFDDLCLLVVVQFLSVRVQQRRVVDQRHNLLVLPCKPFDHTPAQTPPNLTLPSEIVNGLPSLNRRAESKPTVEAKNRYCHILG